jgi:hypothetical protein
VVRRLTRTSLVKLHNRPNTESKWSKRGVLYIKNLSSSR